MFIRIRSDNGWEECQSCSHCQSELCHSCDEADQYEPADQDLNSIVDRMELLAA